MTSRLWAITLSFILVHGGCKPTSDCSELAIKEAPNYPRDSAFRNGFSEYRNWLLKTFNETPAQSADIPTYHFMYYTAFEYGKSIKFENPAPNNYRLTVKCIQDTNSLASCHDYQIGIDLGEWNELLLLLDEYDFWTEEQAFRYREALDGSTMVLEGTRFVAENCNTKSYQFLGRRNPKRDKIASLFEEILFYEESLDFRYHQ